MLDWILIKLFVKEDWSHNVGDCFRSLPNERSNYWLLGTAKGLHSKYQWAVFSPWTASWASVCKSQKLNLDAMEQCNFCYCGGDNHLYPISCSFFSMTKLILVPGDRDWRSGHKRKIRELTIFEKQFQKTQRRRLKLKIIILAVVRKDVQKVHPKFQSCNYWVWLASNFYVDQLDCWRVPLLLL